VSKELFTPHGGYRKLHSFTFTTMIHLGTIRFCKRFISFKEDPLGKTAGQMIGAARSGRQNIIEGSERAATSRETEIKLTDVARSSLAELLGDYEIYLAENETIPWDAESQASRTLHELQLETFEHTSDCMHDYWAYYHRQKQPFIAWLESEDPFIAANSMIVMIKRTTGMLDAQLKRLGRDFLKDGGFRERMYKSRTTSRQGGTKQDEAPSCPKCGMTMQQRTSSKRSGEPFWGCSKFPDCRGTRPMER
jgi:restriction system protein